MQNDPTRLAERVAALTGPDRGLDAEIHWQVMGGVGVGYRQDAPAYTASLDAAAMLVPEGLFIECMGYDQTATPPWYAQLARLTDSHSHSCRSAHSLAHALLAASLHAHAQGETK